MSKPKKDTLPRPTKRNRDKASTYFIQEFWTVKLKEFIDTIYNHTKEFSAFSPAYFQEVHYHLIAGKPTYYHTENLCEVVRIIKLCKRCARRNTDDCTLEIKVKQERSSAALSILNMTDNLNLFNDGYFPYAWLTIRGYRKIVPLSSPLFSQWISLELYRVEGKPPSSDAINAAKNVLIARAFLESLTHELHNRVAWHDGVLYYDLSDENNRAVRIDSEGWEIVERTPIPLFKRYPHQKAAFTPLRKESQEPHELRAGLERILDFLNHDVTDKAIRILIIVSIVTSFIEGIPHAAMIIHGPHGSGKSTFSEMIKQLVDPSKAPINAFPKGQDNIVQQIDHHWFPVFDNISVLKEWQSDILCRAITGAGTQTRKLYSDDDVVIRYYQRCFSLNGISNIVERPDLLDRSFLLELPRVPDEERRDLRKLWMEFNSEAPYILGTIFDVLSRAIAIYPTIETTGLYRLADWCLWGCAICRAIGVDENDFLTAYSMNRVQQTDEAINASPVASAIYALMLDRDFWKGNATQLLDELLQIIGPLGISADAKKWPKSANAIARRIPHISTSLQEIGIEIKDTNRRDRGNRKIWSISKVGVGTGVRSITESDSELERYLTDSNDIEPDSNDIDEISLGRKRSEMDGEAVSNDINDSNDINGKSLGYIPKSEEDSSKDSRLEPVYDAQQERFNEFVRRATEFGFEEQWISQTDLDRMYPGKDERLKVAHDLVDWNIQGLMSHKTRGKEGPMWKIKDT